MKNIFKLEDFLSSWEFKAPYLLCCSDAESLTMSELVAMADDHHRALWDKLLLNYTESPGLPDLRQAISSQWYTGLSKENILCFAGAEEGIFAALSTLCTKQDHAIVLTPGYQSLKEVPYERAGEITEVKLLEKNNWRIDIKAIEQAIRANTKVVVINFPHNPSGQVLSQNELIGLVELLRKKNIWLFSDEVYRLLGKPAHGWSTPAACVYEKALSLGVMSKSFGLAGLRIGWIACQDQGMLKKLLDFKHYLSITNSAPSEILSLIAIKNQDKIIERNNQIVEHNLALLDDFFSEFKHLFSWVRPHGGCVGFVKYLAFEDVNLFCQRVVTECGVLLMPADIFDANSNHFRIGFGRKNMPQALEKFREYLLSS